MSRLMAVARHTRPLLMPVALRQAFDARRIFRARGLQPGSLVQARRAYLSRVHLIPPWVDLERGVVLDVGANEGNFAAAVLGLAPRARIIAAEPNPEPATRLRARLGDRVEVVEKAVGREVGTAVFNITAQDHNSSLREPMTDKMSALLDDPGWEVTQRLEVPVVTLDELAGDEPVSVLKLDVQGAEMDVLEGGERTLARTDAVLVEVTFFSHYESDATFGALHAELARQGFELVGMSESSVAGEDEVPAWADACYARRERRP